MRAVYTEATHGVVADPTGLLRGAGAPADLIAWVQGRAIDELWDECDRGDWLIWLAAVEHVPIVSIVEAAVACARQAARSLPKGKERRVLAAALRAAKELRSSVICGERAAACEELAGQPKAAAYRSQPRNKLQRAAIATACAARAAEALLAAEARRSAERDHEGRMRAAAVGVGDQIISRGDFPPFLFDPDDELIGVSLAAADATIAEASLALASSSAGPEALERIEGDLSEAVFSILDPVRTGLRQGRPAKELVRAINAEPYGSTLATRKKSDDIEELKQPKRATVAIAAGIVFPIGGVAHHYAGAGTMGWVLTLTGASAIFGIVFGWLSIYAWLAIVAADLVLAPGAVRRENAGTPASSARQFAVGATVFLVAILAGTLV